MISKDIELCLQDMRNIACTGSMTLDAQVRAYDLLDRIVDLPEGVLSLLESAEEYCQVYKANVDVLASSFDADALLSEAQNRIALHNEELNHAQERAKAAEDLHESARTTFDIWQNGGYFSRKKALRVLRSKAGFRLESHRIGNYVAKTYDLMNEALMAYANAQQALFAANVSYKVRPGVYSYIYKCICEARR